MNSPKISLILPVFNAEKTIEKTLNSIIKQTFKDFEVIIIDDGSTDLSHKICDEYAVKDFRIHVIHKINEGVAAARQIGINKTKGEYSIHIDADDWIEPTMLEELYNTAKAQNSDIVIADYFLNTDKFQKVCKQCPTSMNPQHILMDMFNNKLFGALWNKLIRTNLYKKYNASFFQDINHCEDLLIWVQLLQNSDLQISYCPKPFYHYCTNPTSITNNFNRKTYETRIKFRDKLQELLKLSNASETIEKVSFGIFTEAFINKVLTKEEINEGTKIYKKQINQLSSLKWKLGFMLLSIGFINISHKLIHY